MRTLAGGQDDLVIVNSCAVTNEAVRQTRQAIRRAHRARPKARILVTGCAAQTDAAMFAAMPEVERVNGNHEKFDSATFAATSGADRKCVREGMGLYGRVGLGGRRIL